MFESDFSESDPETPLSPEELRLEIAVYRASHLAEHLNERPASQVAELVDRGFLADQVTTLGKYTPASSTLEMVLPKSRDDDFFRYALTSLALRQLATRLDDESTARAILQIGSSELVVGLAEQLTRPFDQARIWAMLAAANPDQPSAAQWRRQAIDLVDSFFESPRSDLEKEDLDGLETLLSELAGAPDLSAAWARWQKSPLLSADTLLRLRTTFLVSLWRGGHWSDPWAQPEARQHPAPDQLGWQLGTLLAGQQEDQFAMAELFFETWLTEDEASAWRLLLPAIQRLASLQPGRAKKLWLGGTKRHAPPAHLFDEKSLPLLRVLDSAQLDFLSHLLPAGLPAVLLTIAQLDLRKDPQSFEKARASLAALMEPAEKLRAALLLAEQVGEAEPALARESLRQVGLVLEAKAYGFEAPWLAFYLELLAKYDPGSLERELHEVVFSPACTPATLLALATHVHSEKLFQSLLSQVERFSIAVAEHELAAFELRAAVLAELGRRLPDLHRGLELLGPLTGQQLLEEEEALRLELATHLLHEGRDAEARQVAEKLQPGPSQRLAEIRMLATGSRKALDAAEIYTVFFDPSSIDDELWGLRSLLESPLDLERSFEARLGQILDPDTRSLFVLHLVGHRAAFEKKHFGRLRDATSLLETARPLLVIEDEHRLAQLAPAIVDLGKLAGPKTALNELLECAEGLARLRQLDGESQLEAFDSLLLAAIGDKDPAVPAPFCDALLHLPELWSAAHPRKFDLRRLIPRIVSTLELLPAVPSLFRTPSRGARWLSRLGKNWELDQAPWPQIIELASLPAADRAACLAGSPSQPDLLEAGVVLLPDSAADLALRLLEKMPPDRRREKLVMRQIRRGCFAAEKPRLRQFFADERLQRQALLFEHLDQDDATFLENLADAVSHGQVDTRDPAARKILHRLWRCSPKLSDAALSQATRNALRRGGQIADSALRVWLHAHLAPCFGEEQPEKIERWHRCFAAAQRARRLDFRLEDPS